MSWKNHFGFVCTPRHNTYQNIQRDRQFSVTYMRPSQTVLASLAATPRCEDGSKPITQALPTFAAETINAAFVEDGYLFLECELQQIVDELGENSLIIGHIISARVAEDALRSSDQDDEDLIFTRHPCSPTCTPVALLKSPAPTSCPSRQASKGKRV